MKNRWIAATIGHVTAAENGGGSQLLHPSLVMSKVDAVKEGRRGGDQTDVTFLCADAGGIQE